MIDDNLLEDNETVTVTLDRITSGDADISWAARSAPPSRSPTTTAQVTIAANDATAAEPANDGQFTVTISNPSDTDTVISYTVSGDATAGSDYTTLSGTVTILRPIPPRRIDVSVIDENLLEDNETVTVTLDRHHVGRCRHHDRGGHGQRHRHDHRRRYGRSHHRGQRRPAAEPSNNGQFTVTISQSE